MASIKCCVVGCTSTSKSHRLYNLPKDDELRALWLSFLVPVNSELLLLSKDQLVNKRVCQKHFDKYQLDDKGNRLHDGYPCLFSIEEVERGVPLSGDHYDHSYSKKEDIEEITKHPVVAKEHPVDNLYSKSATNPPASSFLNTVPTPSNWSSLPSNSPSSFTEDCGLNKDMSEEECTTTLFCICCLNSEIPYINLSTCSHGDFLNSFVMPEMHLKDQVVCYQCHSTLKKIKLFKLQIEKSFNILADSVVKNAKSGQKSSTLQTSQLFTIDISSKLYKRKLQTKEGEDPQSKQKKADKDNLILDEIPKTNITESPQTITEHAKIKKKKKGSLPVIDKKSKNIEDALKIININQNSGCINLLTSSLQTISYSILGNIYNTNSDINNQLSIPKDILSSIINTANNAAPISSENILTNTKENSITDLKIVNKISYNMNTLTTPTTEVSSENISMNNTVESNEIIIEDNIESENLEVDENITNEAFNLIEKDESLNDGQSDMQTDKPIINNPSLGSNIRQLTLTREQLMVERSKISSSKTYLQLPHRCETCLVGFQFRENLDDHVNRKHSGKRILNPKQCDVCLQFMEASAHDSHLISHLTRYECIACAQQFASYDKAAQHYKTRHRVTY